MTHHGFSLEVNIHRNTTDWIGRLNNPLQIQTREPACSIPQFLRISVWRDQCVSVSVSVGSACGLWHCWEPSVVFDKCVVCMCGYVCVHRSDTSHLICPWNEMNKEAPSPPTLPFSLVCQADISPPPVVLEGNESWQHNGIVSADGELKS